jgi:plastocyanin
MKFFFALLATLFLATPAWAVDVMMGANGNLVFEPAEVTISAGESVHFVNNMLPPHNVIVMLHSPKQVTTLTGVVHTKEQE